jgi:methyl-accepting chemotaxis protein
LEKVKTVKAVGIADQKNCDECLDSGSLVEALDKFANTFEASARRWEIIVYPAMIAFVILAAYGFFLIYSLTSNVTRVTDYMADVTENMATVSEDMRLVSERMATMSTNIGSMSGDTDELTQSINNMNQQIYTMNQNIAIMTGSINRMGADMGQLNYNVGRPAEFMDDFMPW